MNDELESWLERLRAAPDDQMDEWVDKVAARGEEAITAVRPWLTSAETASRAVRVIEATSKHRVAKTKVCAELADIRATDEYRPAHSSARAARARLGCPKPGQQPPGPRPHNDNPWRKPGNRTFLRAHGQWHVVDGTMIADGEVTRYFTVCHRWNSRGYIEGATEGGVRRDAPAKELLCTLCRNVELAGHPLPGSHWRARTDGRADGTRVTYMWHDESRHVAIEPAPIESPELGLVCLTKCGRVVEHGRVTIRTEGVPVPPDLRPCETCEQHADAGATAPDERG